MKNRALLLIGALTILMACKEEKKNTEFTFFRSAKAAGYDLTIYYETVLVNNFPKDTLDLQKKMITCRYELGYSQDSVKSQTDIDYYQITFYKKNRHTSYFIDHEEYFRGFGRNTLGDNQNDLLGALYEDYFPDGKRIFYMVTNIGNAPYFEGNGGYNLVSDTLLNECDSTWYGRNKNKELVKFTFAEEEKRSIGALYPVKPGQTPKGVPDNIKTDKKE